MVATATDKQSGTAQRRAEKLALELERLSEAVRARNAGASSEVKEAVDVLAVELARMAGALRQAPTPAAIRDEAVVQGHLAVLDAKDKLHVIEDSVRGALEGAARSSRFIGDTAKMKLALAKLEATDLFEEKRRRLQQERKHLDAVSAKALDDLDDRLTRLIGAAMLK